jgi:membrane peptidoglycan carboxypeptidase
VESLDVLQGATLAALIPAPNALDPFRDPERARQRRNAVLREMAETGRLSSRAYAILRDRPLRVRRGPRPLERFPSYVGYVREAVDEHVARQAATRHGLSIFTAMELAWQAQSEAALAAGLRSLDGGYGRARRHQGAFVALEPASHQVRAMVGGRHPRVGDFNRAYQARRQTGSAVKPVVYAAAFLSSHGFTPASTLPDTLRSFGEGRQLWRPRNFDGSYHRQVTLAKALAKSLNVATANLVEMVGPSEVARLAESLGLGRLRAVPSIGLGTGEVSLLDLTNGYAAFADGGRQRAPSPLRAVVDRGGRVLAGPPEEATQVLPEGIADLMTGLLENVVRYGVGYPLRAVYGFDRPAAGKTGTTDEFRDAWFVGFTPEVVAGVWVGYDRPRTIGRQAAHTALPVWARIVGRMLAGFPPAPLAAEARLEWRDIDPWTGLLADSAAGCPAERVPFLPGTAPTWFCQHGYPYDYGDEDLDSLYALDSTWTEPPPDSLFEELESESDTLWPENEPEPLPESEPLPPSEPEPLRRPPRGRSGRP